MTKKKVNFIATKYKNRKVKIDFYTENGKIVEANVVKRAPKTQKVEFFVMQS